MANLSCCTLSIGAIDAVLGPSWRGGLKSGALVRTLQAVSSSS